MSLYSSLPSLKKKEGATNPMKLLPRKVISAANGGSLIKKMQEKRKQKQIAAKAAEAESKLTESQRKGLELMKKIQERKDSLSNKVAEIRAKQEQLQQDDIFRGAGGTDNIVSDEEEEKAGNNDAEPETEGKKKKKRLKWIRKEPIKTLQLEVTKDGRLIRVWKLGEKTRYLIGREMGKVDIFLRNPSVSRQHAAIVHGTQSGKFGATLIDLNSKSGTYFKKSKTSSTRHKVKTGQGVSLREGMCIQFGESTRDYVVQGLTGSVPVATTTIASTADGSIANPFRNRVEDLGELISQRAGHSHVMEMALTSIGPSTGVVADGKGGDSSSNSSSGGGGDSLAGALDLASKHAGNIGQKRLAETAFVGQASIAKSRHDYQRQKIKQATKRARLI